MTKDTPRTTRTEKVQTRTVESRTIEVWASELSRYQRKRREIVFPAEIFANASDPERVPVWHIRVGFNYDKIREQHDVHHLDHADSLRFEFAVSL